MMAIHVRNWVNDGFSKKYILKPFLWQVIFGEELPYTVSTFGFSLSGGKDLDGNQYPDLIVGAYESDAVAYFRWNLALNCRLCEFRSHLWHKLHFYNLNLKNIADPSQWSE